MTDKTEAQPEALRLAAEFEDCIRIDAIPSINDVKKSAAELRRQHAEIQQLKAQQNELREEQRLCMLEASGLANSMFKKHFSHERHYASGEVVWGLCDNVRGVISQIDNMASSLVRPEAQLSARQAAPNGWRLRIPGRRHTDQWDSARVGDYNSGWNDCQKTVCAALSAAPPPPEREPLSETQVRGLLESAGYWPGEDAQRADFINGLRYCEMAHGIGATND